MNPLAAYLQSRLHHRVFVAYATAIVATALTVALVMSLASVHGRPSWHDEVVRLQGFVGQRFAEVWHDAPARDRLARAMSEELDVDLRLLDGAGRTVASFGASCRHPHLDAPVLVEGRVAGRVLVCGPRHHPPGGAARLALALVAAGVVLWVLAGRLSRQVTRPLSELVQVVQDIGRGRLARRSALCCGVPDELGRVGQVVHDMAERIERQMGDQRQLLAAVSHEIRAPLARLRFLLEQARDEGATPTVLDEIDRELTGIDTLVGDLLATSRLDFAALSPRRLDASGLARHALERARLDAGLLSVEAPGAGVEGDATLVACALDNLIANARKHGDGVAAVRVSAAGGRVHLDVEDRGGGFEPGEEARVFEAFYRGPAARTSDRGGVGLGLALVRRIAEAHGGRAYAGNLPGGGARVGMELPEAREDARAVSDDRAG